MSQKCLMCKKIFLEINSYNNHQYYHRNEFNVRFYCKHTNCQREFTTYTNFKMHLYRNHVNKIKEILRLYSCNVYNCYFEATTENKLLSHMYKHITNGKTIKCPHSFCLESNRTFKTISSIKSHFYRRHFRKSLKNKTELDNVNDIHYYSTDSISNLETELQTSKIENQLSICSNSTQTDLRKAYVHSLAGTYLTSQAKYFLTDSALQRIIDGISDINTISIQNTFHVLKNLQIETPMKILKEEDLFSVAHNTKNGMLRSSHVRKQYYKNNFNFVAPVTIKLGSENHNDEFFIYVPIHKTIQSLMCNEDIYKQWESKSKSATGTYLDFIDGECFQQNKFFEDNPKGLQVVLYQDAFEVCNPLGSSRIIHKVVGIYMTLANIAPYCRSKVDQIQLVALCLESQVKKFGFHKIFEIIMHDVRKMENEGVEIRQNKYVKGTIVAVAGDNLGSHQIGGYSQCFSGDKKVCRYCYADKFETQCYGSVACHLRTPNSYESDVEMSSLTGKLKNGVNSDSVLNNCKYFHVCNPGLPPCLAHDIYEGILAYDFMLCLSKLIFEKNVTCDTVNEKMQKLRLDYEVVYQKIPIIKNKAKKLPGSATENLRTILIFPFAMYGLITTDNQTYKMILLLRDICVLLMAVKFSVSQLAYLKYLIAEYINLRTELFPDIDLRPKHHYLFHYPYLIRKFGPLRHLWTLRYESKHLYFKNILRRSANFKNILHTLSEKHQLLQAFHSTQGTLFLDKVISDEAVAYSSEDYDEKLATFISTFCKFENKLITRSATFRGAIYKAGMLLCYKKIDFDCFMLCSIKYILINHDYTDLCFIGNKFLVILNASTGLYERQIDKDDTLAGIYFNNLLTHDVLMEFTSITGQHFYYFRSAPFELL